MVGLLALPSCCLLSSSKTLFHPLPRSGVTPRIARPPPCRPSTRASLNSRSGDGEDEASTTNSGVKEVSSWSKGRVAKAAFAAFAAGLLVLSPAGDAIAAKSGGRVGGQAFRSAPPPRAAPRIDNSRRSNIFINPPPLVAPPLYGGYGAPLVGGWGWSPFSSFAGPSVAIGIGGGFEIFLFLLFIAIIGGIINSFRRNDDDYYD